LDLRSGGHPWRAGGRVAALPCAPSPVRASTLG
jgi:hypothetical protein